MAFRRIAHFYKLLGAKQISKGKLDYEKSKFYVKRTDLPFKHSLNHHYMPTLFNDRNKCLAEELNYVVHDSDLSEETRAKEARILRELESNASRERYRYDFSHRNMYRTLYVDNPDGDDIQPEFTAAHGKQSYPAIAEWQINKSTASHYRLASEKTYIRKLKVTMLRNRELLYQHCDMVEELFKDEANLKATDNPVFVQTAIDLGTELHQILEGLIDDHQVWMSYICHEKKDVFPLKFRQDENRKAWFSEAVDFAESINTPVFLSGKVNDEVVMYFGDLVEVLEENSADRDSEDDSQIGYGADDKMNGLLRDVFTQRIKDAKSESSRKALTTTRSAGFHKVRKAVELLETMVEPEKIEA